MLGQERLLLVGLSGLSSSGKTTIARLLRDVVPDTIILHQDDFYLPEDQLPKRGDLVDWDCAASLDIPAFVDALKHLKRTGEVPPGFVSKEDLNDVGDSGVSPDTVARYHQEFKAWLDSHEAKGVKQKRLCVVDGFLLFGESVKSVRECFDVKLMLRAGYDKAKQRREARSGYATIEGFWEDPPGYFDKIVWPAYVEEHTFLFKNGNVDADEESSITRQLDIKMVPGRGERTVEQMLSWAINEIKSLLMQTSSDSLR